MRGIEWMSVVFFTKTSLLITLLALKCTHIMSIDGNERKWILHNSCCTKGARDMIFSRERYTRVVNSRKAE
jgi:hypothetical protein